MTWHKLNDKQVIKHLSNERIMVIAPKDFKELVIPLYCPLCEFPMKTKEDGLAYRKVELCEKCDYRWTGKVESLDKESQEWIDYLQERVLLSKPIINIK